MIKLDYCEAIDALRRACEYERFQRMFPPSLIAAIDKLPAREDEPGQVTAYTAEHVIAIIEAFNDALRSLKTDAMPSFFATFMQSSLFQDYNRHSGDTAFLEASPAASKPAELEGISIDLEAVPVKPKKHPAFAGVRAKAGQDRIGELPRGLTQTLIEGNLGEYLSGEDKASFASSSKRFFGLSESVREEGKLRKLLQHVVHGEQQEAERILKKYPQLLTQKSEVTDYSDRTFHNASPWECMLWAMDTRYMGQMMLNCIPEGPGGDAIRRECLAQYEAMQVDGGGIHYEQPAACKALVRLGGVVSPNALPFEDIARLFDTPDALLFWNNQFYYANKADASVIPIAPSIDLTSEQITYLSALKTPLTGMRTNTSRLPITLKEHQLINTLFRDHSAFKPTHHHEAHYDFGIIGALQTYVDRFDDLNWGQRDALWINLVAKIQRLAPAHILQHYCDPDGAFYPLPDFKAAAFKRESRFYHWFTEWSNLFSKSSFDSGFGFQFGLIRGLGPDRASGQRRGEWAYHDLIALRGLVEVRTDDAKLLQDHLHQSLAPVPVSPTGQGTI